MTFRISTLEVLKGSGETPYISVKVVSQSFLKFPSGFCQKWQCVEDPTGKLRLYKCKGMAGLYAPRMQALTARGAAQLSAAAAAANSNSCDCGNVGFKKPSVLKRKRMFTKKGTWHLNVLQFW